MRSLICSFFISVILLGCGARAPKLEKQLCEMGLFVSADSTLLIELTCTKRFTVKKEDRLVMSGTWAVYHSDVGDYVEMVRDYGSDTYQFTLDGNCIHFNYPHPTFGVEVMCADER